MKSELIEELAREVGELLPELKELKEELSVVKQERDILYEQYDEMMRANGKDIAELEKQLESAGREHFSDVGKMPEGVEWPRFEDGEPVERPEPADTQEAIDADMTMPPWEYCVRHNLERDDRHLDDDNYIEPMVKHLLERQRNLLIGGECNG